MPRPPKHEKAMHWKVLDHLKVGGPRSAERLVELTGMNERDVRSGIDVLRRLEYNVRNKNKTLVFWLKPGKPPPDVGYWRWQDDELPS